MTLGRALARAGLVAATTALFAGFGPAAPADAHTVSGQGSSNFHTVVTGVAPATPGLTVRAVEDGSRLELTNATGREVIVLGYQGEPYLRLTPTAAATAADPAGVYENETSSTTYLNRSRQYGAIPPTANDKGEPVRWKQIGRVRADGATVVRWHDHSAHYMSSDVTLPGPRSQRQVVFDWDAKLTVAGAPVTVTGQLVWVPGPPAWPWWVLVGVTGLATAALGALARGPQLIAVAGVAVVLVDLGHSVGIALDQAGSFGAQASTFASGNVVEAVAWVLGIVGAGFALRRHIGGLFALGAAGAVIGAVGGLGDVGVFGHSSAPFAGSLVLARALTALTVALGLGLVPACFLAVRRHDRAAANGPDRAAADGPDQAQPAAGPRDDLDISDDLLGPRSGT
ncbi:MAG TPA: hypothetical protein VHE83_06020 [Mycobacteriales bacterium]|nr:hypothetical protein [Mycobacteriales bacterium]